MRPRPLLTLGNALVVAGFACLMAGADARGASKIEIAAIGDDAPGGGQFLGPALTGAPSAAGDGWVAFRTLVTEGSTSEQIVVAKLTGQKSRAVVAALGQSAGKRAGTSLGTFKQFLGRPTVNANGDVAFVALLTNSDAIPGGFEHIGEAQPAGVFLFRQDAAAGAQLRPIALARDVVPNAGAIDLTPIDDSLTTTSLDLLKRTPGLDDAGDVAFVAATYDPDPASTGGASGGAIFVAQLGDAPTAVVRLGDPVTDGVFDTLGAPALNAAGALAFVATVDHGADFFDDGVYLRDPSGTVSRIARDGDTFIPPADPDNSQSLAGFGDLVDINDAGDIAFVAGGMLDLTTFSSSDIGFGVLVAHAGQVRLVTYPGLLVPTYGRIRGGELGPDGGGEVALPSLAPDGTVAVFGQLTGGNGEAVFRASPPAYDLGLPVAKLGGKTPDASPLGGVLFAAESSPTADAFGNLVFFARLGCASVTEALIFRPAAGGNVAIAVGEATPTKGRFGGPPFSSPVINDADDVVFKSSMATGPSALGIFRWRGSDTTVLVRTGDAAPVDGAPAILDLPGDPSLNAVGDVAFAALLAGIGRGVFVADANGIRPIALPNDPVPAPLAPAGALFENVAASPLLLADGTVVFRGSFAYADPVDPLGLFHEEAIFRKDASGTLSILARTTQRSPVGERYFRFQDAATSGSLVAFRAPLGDAIGVDASTLPFGIFLVDPNAFIQTIAVQNQDPGIGQLISGLTSRPTLDAAGNVAFLGKVGADEHAVVVRHGTDGSSTALAEIGGVGPANGTYRSLGRPTMNGIGHLAFRATFEKTGGGIPGFLLAASAPPRSFVAVGESDEGGTGGHLSSLNANAALNAKDHLVFVASVNSGRARNGIFLASPTLADGKGLRLRLRDKTVNQLPTTLGTLRGRLSLVPGDVGKPANGDQAVTITASDALGQLFTLSVDKGALGKSGRSLRAKGSHAVFRRLSIQSGRKRGIRVSFATAPWKAPFRDSNRIKPPLTLRIDVGAHSGSVILPCSVTDGGAVCPSS